MPPDIFAHKLFKNTFIYTICGIIASAIPFLLLPVLTRYLTPFDYGLTAIFQVMLSIVVVLVGLSTHGAVVVNFFKLSREELTVYIGNVIFVLIANFLWVLGIMYLLKTPLSLLVKLPERWMLLAVVVAFCQTVFMLILGIWRAGEKALPYGLLQILQAMGNVGLSLIFVVILGWSWQGRLLGITVSTIIFGALSFYILYKRKYINFIFNTRYIKDVLFFGVPLIPHALGGMIMVGIDRFFISSMVSTAAAGIYTVGYYIGMIIGLLAASFNKAWGPFLYKKLAENDYTTKVKIVKFTYLYDIGIIISALVLGFIAPYFLKFFVGSDFYPAYKYVPWVALGYAANGMYLMVANYIFYVKKTHILAWITFIAACVNMVLNYFLIKANGVVGAAQATAITFFLCFLMTWFLSAKVYKMPWRLRNKV